MVDCLLLLLGPLWYRPCSWGDIRTFKKVAGFLGRNLFGTAGSSLRFMRFGWRCYCERHWSLCLDGNGKSRALFAKLYPKNLPGIDRPLVPLFWRCFGIGWGVSGCSAGADCLVFLDPVTATSCCFLIAGINDARRTIAGRV